MPKCAKDITFCISLSLWIPAADRNPLKAWLRDQIQTANRMLAVIGAAVQVTSIHNLPSVHANIETVRERDRIGRLGRQAPLRWFVVRHLTDSEDRHLERRGVTWRHKGGVWVIEDSDSASWVLAHELGHVLGLPHDDGDTSVMNKFDWERRRPAIEQAGGLGFGDGQQPIMRKTLASLVRAGLVRTLR